MSTAVGPAASANTVKSGDHPASGAARDGRVGVGWTIQEAEGLLMSLKGVMSARMVTRPGGEVLETHLLTTDEVKPKQTVRNVESALLAHLDLEVDHRKISVAQTKERPPERAEPEATVILLPDPPAGERRLLFHSHQVETERSHRTLPPSGNRMAGRSLRR